MNIRIQDIYNYKNKNKVAKVKELKDQLMYEYGDKYTEEEAQYAIDNLE